MIRPYSRLVQPETGWLTPDWPSLVWGGLAGAAGALRVHSEPSCAAEDSVRTVRRVSSHVGPTVSC